MALTSSAVNACGVVVKLDNVDSVLADISGSSNEVSMDFSNKLGEVKAFGSQWPVRLQCGKDASIKLNVIYTQSDDEGLTILREWYFGNTGAKTLQVDIPNSDVGGDRYTMEVLIEKMSVPTKADEAGPIMVSCDLKPTGVVTCTVIGS
jgi:hypothetical protein